MSACWLLVWRKVTVKCLELTIQQPSQYLYSTTFILLCGNVQEIRSNTFLNAKNLQYLYLQYNSISALELDLCYNQLSSIDASAFRGQFNLGNLWLKHFAGKCVDFLIFKINSLSSKMFQLFYNTSLALNLRNNLCIDQYFK